MNYLAHALPFLDQPYVAAGTGVPDWLSVADRAVRVRIKHARPLVADADPILAAVARGAIQHIHDDRVFHRTRAFAELSMDLSVRSREVLGADAGFRPAFLGHLLVEVLLDASLAADDAAGLEAYYRLLDAIDPAVVEAAVNRISPQPTRRLALFIAEFRRLRILWDYLEDGKLWRRMSQVMRRVGLAELPERFVELLPEAREAVGARRDELLAGTPAEWEASARPADHGPGPSDD